MVETTNTSAMNVSDGGARKVEQRGNTTSIDTDKDMGMTLIGRKQGLAQNDTLTGKQVKRARGGISKSNERITLELQISYKDEIITTEEGVELYACIVQDLICSDLITSIKTNMDQVVEVTDTLETLEQFICVPQVIIGPNGQHVFIAFISITTEDETQDIVHRISNTLEVTVAIRSGDNY